MLFLQATKVQVGKDVPEQDQTVERRRLQHSQGSGCTADLGAKMKIRQNYGLGENHQVYVASIREVSAAHAAFSSMVTDFTGEPGPAACELCRSMISSRNSGISKSA